MVTSFPIVISTIFLSPFKGLELNGYSYLSASTGLRVAARQLCQLTVSSAIVNATKPAKANIHQLSGVL